jgi:amidase
VTVVSSQSEIAFLPATELAARIRSRDLSPVEAIDAARAQFEALNPIVNAVVTPAYDQARVEAGRAEQAVLRGDAVGPLHGVPIGLKDLTETAGLRTTYGSKLFEDHVPTEDALLVQRLKAAGGIVVGKTNAPEFAAGINTRNPIFGTTVSPWNTDLSSGGSSGGSAVALATGMCALAEGSDHGGSLRNPAAINGVVGFRVSAGRIPAYPNPWVFDAFSVHGPMARTVRDAALMLSVMAGPDDRVPISISEPGETFAGAAEGGIKGWRVAWTPDLNGLFAVDADVVDVTRTAARRFETLGCVVDEAGPDLHDVLDVIVPLRALRTAVVHQEQLAQMDRVQNAFLKDFVGRVGRLSALEVARAESLRSRLWARVRTFFETYNILVLPATQMAGFSKDDDRPTRLGGRPVQDAVHTTLSTYAISATGLPAISIPCGYTPEGLPIGLQIVGRWRREADVLRAAAAFEDVFPWSDRRPPLVTTALAVAPKDA